MNFFTVAALYFYYLKVKMSCTILYPLLLLLVFSCACISEIQQTERTEPLPCKSCAAENQQSCLAGICPLLAELTSTLQANMDQESLRRKGNEHVIFTKMKTEQLIKKTL